MMADPREFLLRLQAGRIARVVPRRRSRFLLGQTTYCLGETEGRTGAMRRVVELTRDMRNLDYRSGPLYYLHSETAASLTNCRYTRRLTGQKRDCSPFRHQRTAFPSKNLGRDVLLRLNLRHA